MTAGHKHREIKMTPGSLPYRILKKPLYYTRDEKWVNESRLVFGPTDEDGTYYLSLLGVLHGWFGLTIRTPCP